MERLTTDETYCQFIDCDADAEGCACDCTECRMYKRLQAYEQTGLEPETIREIVQSILNLEAVKGFDYLKSLVGADAAERLIVLPCKVGGTIYTTESRYYNGALHTGVQAGTVYGFQLTSNIVMKKCEWVLWAHMEKDGAYDGNAYRLADIGRTVFLTREEAEAALGGVSDDAH